MVIYKIDRRGSKNRILGRTPKLIRRVQKSFSRTDPNFYLFKTLFSHFLLPGLVTSIHKENENEARNIVNVSHLILSEIKQIKKILEKIFSNK